MSVCLSVCVCGERERVKGIRFEKKDQLCEVRVLVSGRGDGLRRGGLGGGGPLERRGLGSGGRLQLLASRQELTTHLQRGTRRSTDVSHAC